MYNFLLKTFFFYLHDAKQVESEKSHIGVYDFITQAVT